MTETETTDVREHLNHCVEALREGIMCHGDTSVVTLRWGHKQPVPLANWTMPHVCKRWDDVSEWASKNYVQHLHDPGWLKHPTLGELSLDLGVKRVV
jgi:hypothetical protein